MPDFIALGSPRDPRVHARVIVFLLIFSGLLSLGLFASQG